MKARDSINNIRAYLQRVIHSPIAINAAISLFWQLSRATLLAAWILMLARYLGPDAYGIFAGVTGVAISLGSFAGLGLGLLMYQEVIRNPLKFHAFWQKSLFLTISSGIILFIVFAALCKYIYTTVSPYTIVALGLSEIVFSPIATLCCFAFAAQNKIRWSAAIPVISALARCCAIISFYFIEESNSINTYAWYHLAASCLACVLSIIVVRVKLSPRATQLDIQRDEITSGITYAFSWATTNGLSSLDKSFTLKFGGDEVAGFYSSLYRLSSIFTMPVDALIGAATPKLFVQRTTSKITSGVIGYLIFGLAIYSLLAAIIVALSENIFLLLLGSKFLIAIQSIELLSFWIPLYALRALTSNILMTSNRVASKVAIECIGLALLFALGSILTPIYGLKGAIFTLLITEASLGIIGTIAIMKNHFYPKS